MKKYFLLFTAFSLVASNASAGYFKYLKKTDLDRSNYSPHQWDRVTKYQTEAQLKAKKEMDELRNSVPGMSFQDGMARSENLTEVSGALVSKDEGKSGVLNVLVNHAEQKFVKQKIPMSEVNFNPTETAVQGYSDSQLPDVVNYSIFREYNHNLNLDPKKKLIENGKEVKKKSVYEVFTAEVVDGKTRRVRNSWKEETDGKLKSLTFNRRDHVGREKKGRTLDYKYTDEKGELKSMSLNIPDDLHVLDFEMQGNQVFLQGIDVNGKSVPIEWDIRHGQQMAEKSRKILSEKVARDLRLFDIAESGPAVTQVVKAGQGFRGMKVDTSASSPAHSSK